MSENILSKANKTQTCLVALLKVLLAQSEAISLKDLKKATNKELKESGMGYGIEDNRTMKHYCTTIQTIYGEDAIYETSYSAESEEKKRQIPKQTIYINNNILKPEQVWFLLDAIGSLRYIPDIYRNELMKHLREQNQVEQWNNPRKIQEFAYDESLNDRKITDKYGCDYDSEGNQIKQPEYPEAFFKKRVNQLYQIVSKIKQGLSCKVPLVTFEFINHDQVFERQIVPVDTIMHKGGYYLIGHFTNGKNPKSDDFKIYPNFANVRVDLMRNIVVQEEQVTLTILDKQEENNIEMDASNKDTSNIKINDSLKKLNEARNSLTGFIDNNKIEGVKIRCKKDNIIYLYDELGASCIESQLESAETIDGEETIDCKLRSVSEKDIKNWAKKFMDLATVIEPPELVAKIHAEMKEVCKRYEDLTNK